MLDYIEASIDAVTSACPSATVILAGDFNTLDDTEIVSRNALISIVNRLTRGALKHDRIFVNDATYTTVSVVTSTVKSDHKAVIANTGPRPKPINKSRLIYCSVYFAVHLLSKLRPSTVYVGYAWSKLQIHFATETPKLSPAEF